MLLTIWETYRAWFLPSLLTSKRPRTFIRDEMGITSIYVDAEFNIRFERDGNEVQDPIKVNALKDEYGRLILNGISAWENMPDNRLMVFSTQGYIRVLDAEAQNLSDVRIPNPWMDDDLEAHESYC